MKKKQLLLVALFLAPVISHGSVNSQFVTSMNSIFPSGPAVQLMKKLDQLYEQEDNTQNDLQNNVDGLKELKKLVEQEADLNEKHPETGDTLLHYAVDLNFVKETEFLLNNGARILPNFFGETALHLAAHHGNLPLIKMLYDSSKNQLQDSINNKSNNNVTPLQQALQSCTCGNLENPQYLEIVKFLIDKGAKLNNEDIFDAGSLELLTYLVEERKIPVTITRSDGKTLLHTAALFNAPAAMVNYLLKKGLNPNAQDNAGEAPIAYLWIEDNSIDVARLLLKAGASLSQKNPHTGQTPFHYYLVNLIPSYASEYLPHFFKLLDLFIENGATVDTENAFQQTPLHDIPYNQGSSKAVILYLLRKGADINHQDNMGNTPLIKAVQLNLPEIAQLFIKNGADWTIPNNAGHNALQEANLHSPDLLEDLIAYAFTQRTGCAISELPLKRPTTQNVLKAFVYIFNYGRVLPRHVQPNTLENVVLKFVLALTKGVPFEKLTLSPQEKGLCTKFFTMTPKDFREHTFSTQKFFEYDNKNKKEQVKTLFLGFNKKLLHDIKLNK